MAAGVGSRGPHGWLREVRETNFHSVTAAVAAYKSVARSKGDQFQQTCHRAPRFAACGHLATSIEVGHPRGNEHTTVLCLKFELLNIASSELPGNRQILTVERVKRVVNRGVARIAGIFLEQRNVSTTLRQLPWEISG